MRVLHVLDHSLPLHSGYTFRTRAILRQQRAMGFETFHLTSPKQGPVTAMVESIDGLTFHRSRPTAPWGRIPGLDPLAVIEATAQRLDEVVAEVRPDLIHAHSPALNGAAALRVGRKHRLPVVYEVRAFWEDAAVDHGTCREDGIRYRLARQLETRVLRGATAITTICQGLKDDIQGRGIPGAKVTVVPNAVDLEAFNPKPADGALKAKLGLENAVVLGFIGSFYAYEGLDLLLETLPALTAQAPEVRVLLVGGGPQETALKARVAADPLLAAQVVFTGRVPHQQVQAYYDLVDIFVYPRRSMRLTEKVTPLKPLEAMAQHRLVVASDVGGHRELIRPGETGELFSAGDAKALAGAVLGLLAHPEQWPQRRAAGRAFVEGERNWPTVVARYRGVYNDATATLGEGSRAA
ncbi:MAG: TIGR04063 family PEP-CTERM/XrtA system glycosyltransferase [Candidatus Competibacterales bacterium]